MTVAELIDELTKFPPDMVVIMQTDSEGNGYSKLEGVDGRNLVFTANKEVKYKELTPSMRRAKYTEEDLGVGEDCAVLYPVD